LRSKGEKTRGGDKVARKRAWRRGNNKKKEGWRKGVKGGWVGLRKGIKKKKKVTSGHH